MVPGFDDTLDRASELAERGVALDGTSAIALSRLGWIQLFLRRYDQAIENFEQAIALAPSDGGILANFGHVLNYWGDPERGQEMIEKALSLETFVPPLWEFQLGLSHLLLRHYDDALTRFNQVIERTQKIIHAYTYMACAYVELNRLDDARNAIKTLLETAPQITLREADRFLAFRRDEDRNRILDSLRKAGLPEGGEVEDEPPPLPDKPSIAVLPFDNMSRDLDQAYFAEGMAEDIITALSRFHWFYVAARHSSFIYKNQNVDVRQVGKELGVRYVLEGSVRKGGDQLRINVQLVETANGNHLWANTFDGTLADVFDLQDQITEGVVGAVEPSVQKAEIERARRKRPDSLDAYDLYLQALPHAWVTTQEETEKALDLLDEALRIDPAYASAHGLATVCCLHLFLRGGMDPAVRDKAIRHCRAVIDSKTDDANALAFAGFIYATFASDKDGAFGAAERAIALNPNGARALTNSAMVHVIFGNYETAIEFANRAVQLNPLDPMRYGPECTLSFCYYHTGRFADAIEAAVRSIQSNS
ncbi:MAG: tetratricopeptide repeat protein, partial [Alphaproteobacteria bacterium]|nr:tetratricopeptide repeat protein [Alphaproteobacteria bacterium]